MFIFHDPDEWESVYESKSYGRDPFGHTLGSCSYSLRRRAPEEVAKIKAERQRKHEDAVLAEAEFIIAKRRRDERAGKSLDEMKPNT